MTRLELVRSGGFAGVSLRAAVDTAATDEQEAAWYDEALAGLDLEALCTPAGGGAAPDRFVYRLAVEHEGQRYEATFGEADVPEPLRPVITRLVGRARST